MARVMTVRRKFSCNLCFESLLESGDNGIGIVFQNGKIRFKLIQDAENHLCNHCVEGVWAERQFQNTEDRS